jgi:hypothetical protein
MQCRSFETDTRCPTQPQAPNVVWHWGEWEGFTSYLRSDLKRETLLVVLSNLGPSICVDAISAEIAALVEQL